jgi:hypothetical protein
MPSIAPRTVAFLLVATMLPTAALAEPPPRSLLEMREENPESPATPNPAVAPPEMPVPVDTPVAAPPEVVATDDLPPPVAAPDDDWRIAMARDEEVRDMGGSTMVAGGAVTIGGVILIIAGFAATGAAVKQSDCDNETCGIDRKVLDAARVTLAGLVFSGLGALTLGTGMAVYGVGRARVERARRGHFDGVAFDPSSRGGALALRGHF